MNTSPPPVHQHTLEDFFGTSHENANERINEARRLLLANDLLIHIVVLAHGNDSSRIMSTIATLNMLNKHVKSEAVHIWLSYQGEEEPTLLMNYRKKHGLKNINKDFNDKPAVKTIQKTGKTENILQSLAILRSLYPINPQQQFVIFLDNDYMMHDPINVHSLYIPWVMNTQRGKTISREHIYVKAGGLRLKLKMAENSHVIESEPKEPLTFIELCKEALQCANMDIHLLDKVIPLLPTKSIFENTLGISTTSELERAIDLIATPGGRSNRGVSSYLHAHRDNPMAKFLSEFTFLLHGDQGTSLSNWMDMRLSSGYGLELSFLKCAASDEANRIINMIGLPHAHHPKNDLDNFKLGIEMFALLRELVESAPYSSPDDTWHYSSPSRLGYQSSKMNKIENSIQYEPLNLLLHESR